MLIGVVIWLLEVFIGVGLLFNCLRGLATQEGVYDEQSSQMMNVSQLLGILLALVLLADATGVIHIPLPFVPGCGG